MIKSEYSRVGVECLSVDRISCVEALSRLVDVEQWSGWICSEDDLNSGVCAFSGVTSNVGTERVANDVRSSPSRETRTNKVVD